MSALQVPFFPSEATLTERYPGAPMPFIKAFLKSGKSMRHFMPMRQAWQAAIFHAVELGNKTPGVSAALGWNLNKDA